MPYPNIIRQSAGFTLIELMISMVLGIAILLTCFAGLRITAQTVSVSKQMSRENMLLRLGIEQAMDEADFWTLSDNPTDSTRQPLRGLETSPASCVGTAYLPFSSFTQTFDYAKNPLNGTPVFEDGATGFDEATSNLHTGWNPHPLAWAAWNPRTWTRSNVAETAVVTQWFGTFEIYDNLDTSKSWHYWYDDQVRGLIDALGFYGVYEYLPSNAYIIYHGPGAPLASPGVGTQSASNLAWTVGQHWGSYTPTSTMSWGSQPIALMMDGEWECPTDGQDYNMKGRIRNTNGNICFFPGPQADSPQNPGLSRTYASVGYIGQGLQYNPALLSAFLSNSVASADLTPIRPTTWDDVTFESHRYMERGHPLILNIVTCRSSLSSNSFVVPFSCVGTTLRGARQQRSPTSGWVVNPYTDATLDYQAPP